MTKSSEDAASWLGLLVAPIFWGVSVLTGILLSLLFLAAGLLALVLAFSIRHWSQRTGAPVGLAWPPAATGLRGLAFGGMAFAAVVLASDAISAILGAISVLCLLVAAYMLKLQPEAGGESQAAESGAGERQLPL